MLVRKDISFLISIGRVFCQVAVAVVFLSSVFVMNSVFPGTAGEADNKSIMPCCRF